MPTAEQQLGQLIGTLANENTTLQNNVYPNDSAAPLYLNPNDLITITISGSYTANNLSSSSFYLDHPVYGELDSSILALDGGYLSSSILGSFS